MITDVEIKNIRGIKTGAVTGMTPINVFVGPNNSGKSTILDALYIGAHPNPSAAYSSNMHRRDVSEPQKWFLHKDNDNPSVNGEIEPRANFQVARSVKIPTSGGVEISPVYEEGVLEEEFALRASVFPADSIEAKTRDFRLQGIQEYLTKAKRDVTSDWPVQEVILYDPQRSSQGRSLPELYTLAAESGLSDQVNGILSDLLPDVKRVELLAPQGKPVVYLAMKHGGALPLGIAGDGVRLLVRLSMELAVKAGGLALLEEPETHLHPAAIHQAARAIHAAAGRDIQIALSTHSLELVDALLSEAPAKRDQVTVFRTALDKGGTLLTHRLSGADAFDARMKISEDLR